MNRTQAEMKAFGEKVKMYRKQLGLTQRDFLPKFSHTMIARYENGKAMPRGRRLWDLAEVLKVHPDDLVPPSAQALSMTRHRSYSRAIDAMNCGDWDAAFQAAQDFSRLAFRLGDSNLIDQSHILFANITPHIDEDALVLGVLRSTRDLVTLRKLVTKAFHSGHWQWALLINEAEWRLIHEGAAFNEEDYGRIIRNRGRIHMEVGNFVDAVAWYQRAQELAKHRQTAMLFHATLLSAAESCLHGGLPMPDLTGFELHVTESRMLWRGYWHLRGLDAWRRHDWADLSRVLQQAQETFIWPDGRDDLLMEGLTAVLRVHQGADGALERFEQVLQLRNIDEVAGDGARRDLLFDYLQLLLDMDHPAAPLEWATAVYAAHTTDRPGWVRYYLQRPPEILNWAAIPMDVRAVVQQVMDEPPGLAQDELVAEDQSTH